MTTDTTSRLARPDELSDADRAELPDLGTAFNDGLVWAHHRALDTH